VGRRRRLKQIAGGGGGTKCKPAATLKAVAIPEPCDRFRRRLAYRGAIRQLILRLVVYAARKKETQSILRPRRILSHEVENERRQPMSGESQLLAGGIRRPVMLVARGSC